MDKKLLQALQDRTAQAAIGASALRNQGGPGYVEAAREALKRVRLARFMVQSETDFRKQLDRVTKEIQRQLPQGARWGTARKAVNIFLRDVLYNTYLARAFGFRRIERWLELPLDSYTVRALRNEKAAGKLPRFPGVAAVDPTTYDAFQAAAKKVAQERKIARVHLDVFWWRQPLSVQRVRGTD